MIIQVSSAVLAVEEIDLSLIRVSSLIVNACTYVCVLTNEELIIGYNYEYMHVLLVQVHAQFRSHFIFRMQLEYRHSEWEYSAAIFSKCIPSSI